MTAKALSDLTSKRHAGKIIWWQEHQRAFNSLKDEIRENAVLYVFKEGKPFN